MGRCYDVADVAMLLCGYVLVNSWSAEAERLRGIEFIGLS